MRPSRPTAGRLSRPVRLAAAGLSVWVAQAPWPLAAGQAAPARPQPLAVGRLADPRSQAGVAAPTVMGASAQPAAQQRLPPLPVTRLAERPREEVLEAGRTFSVRLTEPVPVRDLLLLLVRDTRFSIVAAPGVEGTFVGELKDVTLKQALDLVLHPLGLEYAVEQSFIRVFPRRIETRRFDLNYVATARTTRRMLGGLSGAADRPGGAEAEVASTDRVELFDEVAAGLRTLLSPDGRFNLDRKAALLQVSDYPDRLDQVHLYLEAVEARVTRQVAIHAWVVEIELDAAHAGGVDWRALVGDALTVTQASVPALLSAFERQGTVHVLAAPRLVAMNNEPAVMRVGRQEVAFGPAAAPRTVAEGLTLTITPQISADGFIQMSVLPSVTEREGETTSPEGDRAPVLSVREADTLVRVREGETVILSGFMRGRDGVRTDLVILLAPSILRPGAAGEVAPAAGGSGADRGPGREPGRRSP